MVVENACGRLKRRWWCLLERMDFILQHMCQHVLFCTTCMATTALKSGQIAHPPQTPPPASSSTGSTEANDIRDAIMKHLSSVM